ncbi:MAG: cobalt ECF transporter T component CbiQ [Deltaproteobacteria bacterium]|nr:cobalt ECF transporter T component CbiQ [Deltaproteobacteria bacterium]
MSHVEEFALGDSIIHQLDPRAKIIAAAAFSTAVALNTSLAVTAAAITIPVTLALLARMNLRAVFRRLLIVNGFVLLLGVSLPFTYSGQVLWTIGPLHIHEQGLRHAALIGLKSNVIVLTLMALLGTSPVFHLAHALSHMGAPEKLVHIFFFCFRYVHVIHEEYHRLIDAMKIRAFRPRTDLHTYRAYAYLVGMLLVRSFDRSLRIMEAMRCRGFKGKFYILHHYNMRQTDYLVTAASLLLSSSLLALS